MKKGEIGVVVLPMIFGGSLSTILRCLALERLGYPAEEIDLYRNQRFSRPFFGKVLRGNEKANLAELAERFDDDMVLQVVKEAVVRLFHVRGCRRFVLVGFGLGSVYALRYAQQERLDLYEIAGVAAWYPHLIFPPGFPKEAPSIQQTACSVRMFFGLQDSKLEPGTIELAKSLDSQRIETTCYRGADHAFADWAVQTIFPNPYYRSRAARDSWRCFLHFLRSL